MKGMCEDSETLIHEEQQPVWEAKYTALKHGGVVMVKWCIISYVLHFELYPKNSGEEAVKLSVIQEDAITRESIRTGNAVRECIKMCRLVNAGDQYGG